MVQRVAYLFKLHDIPPFLVVSLDHIRNHLVPNRGSKTCETKGSKQVTIHEKENKMQVFTIVSSTANEILLPLQFFFTGTAFRSLLILNEGCRLCKALG